MLCLFCAGIEKNCKPGTDFICSRCVQILLAADQEQLKRAYQKAMDKGYTNKAYAIESFLHERTFDHERETKKPKRGLGRKTVGRMAGPSRDKLWP